MMGTSWLMRTAMQFAQLERSLKALPPPASLYQPRQPAGAGPISFPGWDAYERQQAGNNRDLANAKTAVNSTWVFANAQALAKEFASAELIVKEKQTDGALEDVDNHPLEALWNSPNPHMGRSFLMEFWAWSYTLVGKAYLYWVPAHGQIREVWPIPAFMLAPVPDAQKFIKGYAFKARPDADPILIPAEYITYSHSVNIFDIRDGMSFLVAGMTAIRGDIAASQWNLNFFDENNGVPDGLITVPKDTLDSDLARIRMEIRDFFGGTRRGVAVARAGDLDYKPFGRTQKEAEFLAGRELSSKEIGRLLGFPDGYWSESANRANAEQARATMIAGAVWPLLVRLHEDLNTGIVKRWWGEQFRAEFKDIRPEDRQLKLAEFTTYSAVLTVDELRELIDRDPIGDVRGGMLVAEVTKGVPVPTSAPSQETEEALAAMEEEAAAEDEAAGIAPEGEEMEEEMPVPPMKADLVRWETKALNTLKRKGRATCVFQSDSLEADMRKIIAEALPAARTPQEVRAVFAPFLAQTDLGRTLWRLRSAGPFRTADEINEEVKAARREGGLDAHIARILARAEHDAVAAIMAGGEPDLTRLDTELRAALHGALVEEVLSGVGALGVEFGIGVDTAAAAQLAAEWAASYVPRTTDGITATTRDLVQAAITEYRTTPMTRAQLVERLKHGFSAARAEEIAITESARAQAQSTTQVKQYLAGFGLDYDYVWQTVNDDECALCKPLNDQVVGADNLPPKHPRCRCRVTLRAAGATKHMRGGHDQRSHGRRGGGGRSGAEPRLQAIESELASPYLSRGRRDLLEAQRREIAERASATTAHDPASADQRLRNIDAELASAYTSPGRRALLEEQRRQLAGASAPRTLKQELDAAETEIRGLRHERAIFLSPDGRRLVQVDGDDKSYTVPEREFQSLRGAGATMTHNHPSGHKYEPGDPRHRGDSFSIQDIRQAAHLGLTEVRAVTPTRRYWMKPPKGGWQEHHWRKTIPEAYQRHYDAVLPSLVQQVRAGRISQQEASARLYHEVWLRVSKELGIPYGYEDR